MDHSYLDVSEAREQYADLVNETNAVRVECETMRSDNGGGVTAVVTLHHEGHTIGNLLRYALSDDPRVETVGYREKHPLEPKIAVNLRMKPTSECHPITAIRDAIRSRQALVHRLRQKLRQDVRDMQ
jgi:DNA-directed RNA polymerase subunit L